VTSKTQQDVPATPSAASSPSRLPTPAPRSTVPIGGAPDIDPAVDGRARTVIEAITPRVDDGRFPVKRVEGERIVVEADAFTDGHDAIAVVLRHRGPGETSWTEVPMAHVDNDRWRGEFTVREIGRHAYTVAAWVDHFGTWRRDLRKRVEAGQDVAVDLLIGAELVEQAAERAGEVAAGGDAARLGDIAARLRDPSGPDRATTLALGDELDRLVAAQPDRSRATVHEPPLEVVVDPVRARFSTWYELFPRSASPQPGRHGTFRDVIARLPSIAGLGFDVLYLPPIHPIGRTFRKGPNNVTTASPADPGVPWAIGSDEGGHTAIHPELGTLDDFRALVAAAGKLGIQVALDIAFQASPDHPWVREHPTWFRQRPDGTVQYAENPPKKYQDIYPFDFESEDWRGLWQALADVMRYWLDQGVTIFRVDNPHTKAFPFWEWAIADLKGDHPEVLFLAEAFTRPKVMYRLAKLGFSQSYTYFTWRNTKWELQSYFEELSRPPVVDFFRPNAWPNTPDILHEVLQHGGRPAFQARVILAGMLAANYGLYGPAYELLENVPREPGSEEYLDSEKYQIRHWELDDEASIAPLIGTVNRIRRAHPALQRNEGLAFHPIDDEELLAWTKRSDDGSDVVLTVVSLDFRHPRAGTVELPLEWLGLPADGPVEAEDLVEGGIELWHGGRQRIEIDPGGIPARVIHLRPQRRNETQFETYGG
jgi:starch synthase (maltosyl-transferring)